MDRLVKLNVIAKSGRAVEAAGDVRTLLLDKTGTITFGNRMADELIRPRRPLPAGQAAMLASLGDNTPEGVHPDPGGQEPPDRANWRATSSSPSAPRPG
jgi:K+-transporting ATPase ATPase B chain